MCGVNKWVSQYVQYNCVYTIHDPFLSLQNTGWSALFFAAEVGDLLTTNLLLKAGANALLKDKVSSIQSPVWCVALCVILSRAMQLHWMWPKSMAEKRCVSYSLNISKR